MIIIIGPKTILSGWRTPRQGPLIYLFFAGSGTVVARVVLLGVLLRYLVLATTGTVMAHEYWYQVR